MKLVKNIHVLKVGDTYSSNGDEFNYTTEHLRDIADTYDPSIHEAPIVIGHEGDQAGARPLSHKSQLANGWVKSLKVEGDDLFCDAELDNFTVEALRSKKLKKRSIALYTPQYYANPKLGHFYIRHLALLGAEPPAIKGLSDIIIYKEKSMGDMKAKVQDVLASALNDSGNIFGGEIIAFKPEPSEENNWLYDSEKQQYAGSFIDGEDVEYVFTLSRDEDSEGWVAEIGFANPEDGDVNDDNEEEIVENTENTDATEEIETQSDLAPEGEAVDALLQVDDVSEIDLLKKQLAAQQETLKAYQAEIAKAKKQEIAAFCEQAYAENRLRPSQMAMEELIELLVALATANSVPQYAEGLSVFEGVKKLVKALPNQLQYSDALFARQGIPNTIKSPYANGTDESNKEYAEIVAYMEEKKIPTFIEARRAYMKKKYN